MSLRLPIVTDRKHGQPDYPLIPYTDRSADKYESYNCKPAKKRRTKK